MSTPIRALREGLAAALVPLGVDVYDVLPDTINPPCVAVGLARIGPSAGVVAEWTFSVDVTLVGERADFRSAQVRLDDLEWEVYEVLAKFPGAQLFGATPGPIEVAAQTFPGVTFIIESLLPC